MPQTISKMFLLPCAAALLLVVGACQQVHSPVARVVRADVVDQTEQGGRVALIVEIENPNEDQLRLPELNYEMRVGNYEPFVFKNAVPVITLSPHGLQTMTLYAAFDTDGASLAGQRYDASGTITYRPPSELRNLLTESGIPLPTFRFSSTGVIE